MITITRTSLKSGTWRAELELPPGEEPPELHLYLGGEAISAVSATPIAGRAGAYALSSDLPARVLSDGLSVLILWSGGDAPALAKVVIAAGEIESDDLRAELASLRHEMELVKQALRRLARL